MMLDSHVRHDRRVDAKLRRALGLLCHAATHQRGLERLRRNAIHQDVGRQLLGRVGLERVLHLKAVDQVAAAFTLRLEEVVVRLRDSLGLHLFDSRRLGIEAVETREARPQQCYRLSLVCQESGGRAQPRS